MISPEDNNQLTQPDGTDGQFANDNLIIIIAGGDGGSPGNPGQPPVVARPGWKCKAYDMAVAAAKAAYDATVALADAAYDAAKKRLNDKCNECVTKRNSGDIYCWDIPEGPDPEHPPQRLPAENQCGGYSLSGACAKAYEREMARLNELNAIAHQGAAKLLDDALKSLAKKYPNCVKGTPPGTTGGAGATGASGGAGSVGGEM